MKVNWCLLLRSISSNPRAACSPQTMEHEKVINIDVPDYNLSKRSASSLEGDRVIDKTGDD